MDNELYKSTTTNSKPARWKSALSVLAVLVIAYLVFKTIFNYLLIPILAAILIIANRDLVGKALTFILKQYKEETWKGLVVTVAGFLLIGPFMGFLFLRSIFYMFTDGTKTKINNVESDSTLINIAVKDKIKDLLKEKD
jgi:uncharacterized membrane protein